MRAASLLHTVDSMLGLFEGANSVKNRFKRKFRADMASLLVSSEIGAVLCLGAPLLDISPWDCSSSRVKYLRESSWVEPLVGTTIPHPSKLTGDIQRGIPYCRRCKKGTTSMLRPPSLKESPRNWMSMATCHPTWALAHLRCLLSTTTGKNPHPVT